MIAKVKITYNAGKLADKMPKIIQKHMGRYARSSATGAKENIDKGVSPKLVQRTIDVRKSKGIVGTKPLYETGYLHKSLEGRSDGSLLLGKFISPSEKVILKAFDAFRKNIRRAFKK